MAKKKIKNIDNVDEVLTPDPSQLNSLLELLKNPNVLNYLNNIKDSPSLPENRFEEEVTFEKPIKRHKTKEVTFEDEDIDDNVEVTGLTFKSHEIISPNSPFAHHLRTIQNAERLVTE